MRQGLVIASLIIGAGMLTGLFLALAGAENVVGSGMAFNEKAAVSTLRTLHWAQGDLRKGTYVDRDGDGVGEFGTMEQLAALEPLPSGQMLPAALVPMAGTQVNAGILVAHGYCFRYDLPEGADARERRFVAYAWPALSAAGTKAYCINEHEEILESRNEAGWIGCDKAPPVGACPAPDSDPAWPRWRNKSNRKSVGVLD